MTSISDVYNIDVSTAKVWVHRIYFFIRNKNATLSFKNLKHIVIRVRILTEINKKIQNIFKNKFKISALSKVKIERKTLFYEFQFENCDFCSWENHEKYKTSRFKNKTYLFPCKKKNLQPFFIQKLYTGIRKNCLCKVMQM